MYRFSIDIADRNGSALRRLLRSAERQQKEQAMHARFCERIESALASLQRRIERAHKPIDRGAVERQIGRMLGRNSRAAARYAIRLVDDQLLPAGLRLECSMHAEWDDWSRHSEGCYVLRTNLRDWTSEALWRTYIQLSEAEAAFRINKSELSIRPIWHQREDRVLAHILVCFLAYVLWKTLEQWQSRAGLGNSPRTLLQELAAITSTDVILPTAAAPSRELRLCCVVRPDRAQAILLERLASDLCEQPEFLAHELHHQRLFGREVAVDGADTDARSSRDVVDLRVGPALGENPPCAVEDPLVVAAGVCT